MSTRLRGLTGSCTLILGLAALVPADEVVLTPTATYKAAGGRVRGQITAETPSEVRIKPTTGAEQAIPVDQIATVSYDGSPPSLALAETRENSGALAEASELYKKAVDEAKGKPLVAQAARFGRVRTLADLALAAPQRAGEAITEIEGFVAAYPTSRHIGRALETLIRLQLQKGDIAKAQAALADLTAKVPSAKEHAEIWNGRVLARGGKFDQALVIYDGIIASADKGSARAREAKLAKAETLVGLKKFDDAQAVVLDVIKESPPENAEIQAEAHNTLGDCYRAAGRPKDALLAYLKTDILYDKDKEQHPRALAQIEAVFRDLKRDDRADEIRERHRQLYPQSPYLARGAAPK